MKWAEVNISRLFVTKKFVTRICFTENDMILNFKKLQKSNELI